MSAARHIVAVNFRDPAHPSLSIPMVQEDISASAMLRLTDTWSVGGGVRYDVDAAELRSDSVTIRYADECFILTATYGERLYNSATISDDRLVMLRFELKHLGEFKYKTNATDINYGGSP